MEQGELEIPIEKTATLDVAANSAHSTASVEPLLSDTPFAPAIGLRNPHIQSLSASFKPRNALTWVRGGRALEAQTRDKLFYCNDGVRLHGLLSEPVFDRAGVAPKGVVILLHGWEGCAYSVYLYSLAARLHAEGFAVARLHMRDHGGSAHLNPGLFHGWRLPEILDAVEQLGRWHPDLPHSLAGFSLGGNFALRAAADERAADLNLHRVVGVSPAINPATTVQAFYTAPKAYQRYFSKKMHNALRQKQRHFPNAYDFSWLSDDLALQPLFEGFIRQHAPVPEPELYYEGYRVKEHLLHDSPIRSHVIAAADDPIVPTAYDVAGWKPSSQLTLELHQHGGHCGFLGSWLGNNWLEEQLVSLLALDQPAARSR